MHSAHGPAALRPAREKRQSRLAAPRRAVLAGLASLCLPRFAHAAEFHWRLGHSAPVAFPLHLRLIEAAGAVAARSGGQIAVEIHPNSELGSPVGLLAQLRSGALDMAPMTNQMLSANLSVAALPMLGFAFRGYDQAWAAIDGGVGTFLRSQMQQRLGLVALGRCWDFGFRQVTTDGRPVATAGDMDGLRLRTPPEADFIGLFQALKALPVALPLASLERALASHSVNGQESVLPLVRAAGLYKVQSLCALTNHVWDGQWMCASEKSWAKLPAKLRDIVSAAFDESAARQRQDTVDDNAKDRLELEGLGIKFNEVDVTGFRSLLRSSGYYDSWRARMGDEAWSALEKHTGRLA